VSVKTSNSILILFKKRVRILSAFLALFFFILIFRMWYLQILRGGYFKEKSERQRIRVQRIPAPRGEFTDRNGRVLVDTKPGFNVAIILEDVKHLDQTLNRLSRLLQLPKETFSRVIRKARKNSVPLFQPIRLLSNVPWSTVALLEAHQMELSGISVMPEPLRNYRYGSLAAHLFGYMGEINASELKSLPFSRYRSGDIIGKTGLEKSFEKELKGVDGYRQMEVNSLGRIMEQIGEQPPRPGNRIILTIDYDLQKTLEEAFEGHSGAGVVLNPDNGEILAMASFPSYDPNLFSGGIPKERWKEFLRNPKHPLTDKAISGQYAPGSVFKIVVAVAGLEERVVDPVQTIPCRGFITFGGRKYRCWKHSGHGRVDLYRALSESCDVYFYELGQRLGINRIARYAQELGLGNLTGIPLEGEQPGLIPNSQWKRTVRKEVWYPGETLSASIGQGYILVTPIQLAGLIGAIANGGTVYRPQLVRRIDDCEGNPLKHFTPKVLQDAPISAKTLHLVVNALEGVVSARHGTGGRARVPGIRVAGKTGTAQVVRIRTEPKPGSEISEPLRDHALFVAFAPVEKPEIALAIVVEHGGHGGSVAAPIARKVLKCYFKKTGRIIDLAGKTPGIPTEQRTH